MPNSPAPEKLLAALVFRHVAKHMAPVSLAFLNGILALTGATVALLISKADVLINLVELAHLKWGLALLILSALFGLMARYNTSLVEMSARLEDEGEKLGIEVAATMQKAEGTEFDQRVFEAEVLRGLFPPTRLMIQRGFNKAHEGDHAATARFLAKLAQLSGFLILLQFACVALGPLVIVFGIKA